MHEIFSTQWKSSSLPAPLWTSLKGLAPHNEELLQGLKTHITNLSSLRSLIERYANDEKGAALLQTQNGTLLRLALQRCQRQNTLPEILSVMSDLVARLDRLHLTVQPSTYTTAISFAMLTLSAPALGQVLAAHRLKDMPALGLRESVRVIESCSEALDRMSFEDPAYDRSHMLAQITGEGDFISRDCHRLHDSLYWTQPKDQEDVRYTSQLSAQEYICLLAKLGSVEVLRSCWSNFLRNIQPKNHHSCFAAYQIVVALIQASNAGTAVKYLEEVSQQCGDNLPFLAKFSALQILIEDPVVGEALPDLVRGEDYIELLETQLENMDQRMGIQWSPESQEHTSAALEPLESIWEAFGDQLAPNFGTGPTKPSHESQLYAGLRAHGCSKSPAALNRIIDLLHDHNGEPIEINTYLDYSKDRLREFRSEFGSVEFRWNPESSPIEFSGSQIPALHNSTQPSSPLSLGLLRARLIVGGVPQSGVNSLNLMQVGCIDMRHGVSESWQSSGYIMVWDRQFGELLGLHVGSTGAIDNGPAVVGPFGALMHIRLSSNSDPVGLPPSETTNPRNCWGPYYLDLDPSPDLDFGRPGRLDVI